MNTTIVARLHEQREFPERLPHIRLKKGTIIEELDWDGRTENTTIHKRLVLQDWNWVKEGKWKYLEMNFKKEDLKKARARKERLIKQIINRHYDKLALSFADHLLLSSLVKFELGLLSKKKVIQSIGKAIETGSKKEIIKEV